MSDVVIHVQGIGKRYRLNPRARMTSVSESFAAALAGLRRRLRGARGPSRGQEFWALRDISFDVRAGEVLGIIGPNGAGKSTLLKILARITEPTEGSAEIRGRVSSVLEVGTGFHPELTGRDNVYLNGSILGMKRVEISTKFDEIVEFSGVERFIDVPVKRYSSGMYVRLAFAVAAHLEPEILLVDEVLSVGDQAFQEKCLGRIEEVARAGRTVVFVSHDMAAIKSLCTRGLFIEHGGLVFDGRVEKAVETYLGRRARVVSAGTLERAEREGSGEIRFREVKIANAHGEPQIYPDQPVVITVSLSAERPVPGHHLNLGLSINTPLGERLVTLLTRFDPDQSLRSIDVRDGAIAICRIPELPLRPGKYTLTLYLERSGEIVDRVQNQVEFTILPSDFFGTGSLPSESDGPFLVRHEWRVSEPAAIPGMSRR